MTVLEIKTALEKYDDHMPVRIMMPGGNEELAIERIKIDSGDGRHKRRVLLMALEKDRVVD